MRLNEGLFCKLFRCFNLLLSDVLRAFTGSPEQDASAAPFLWHIVKILFRKERKLGEGRRAALSLALIAPA